MAQQLARHSTISLTLDRYTHLAVADVAGALDRLPEIPANGDRPEAARATGTDGKPSSLVVPPDDFSCPSMSGSGPKAAGLDSSNGPSQETPKPLKNKGSDADPEKRRARDSNPQPASRHLISSQAANQFAYPPTAYW